MSTDEKNTKKPENKPELIKIEIRLGMTSNNISLNGRKYWHGQTYMVTPDIARTLNEIMFRNQWHDREALGRDKTENAYRQHNTINVNRSSAFVTPGR